MKALWAPWREAYLYQTKTKKCIFCLNKKITKAYDKKRFIVYRGDHCFAILNLYPYNNGHVMVVPYRHINSIEKMKDKETLEMMDIIKRIKQILDDKLHPDGYNIGMNLGKTAGAGVAGHVHMHIVPRWNGDTNFMPVLGSTKVVSQSLKSMYKILADNL